MTENADSWSASSGEVLWGDNCFMVPDHVRARWDSLHQGVDIDREIEAAYCWCRDNPRNRPKKCPQRFIGTWLRKAYNAMLRQARQAPDPPPDCCDQRAEIARLLKKRPGQ